MTKGHEGIARANKAQILARQYACGGRNPGSLEWSGKMNNRKGNTRKRKSNTFGYIQKSVTATMRSLRPSSNSISVIDGEVEIIRCVWVKSFAWT